MDKNRLVKNLLLKSTAGGVGYFGIAVIVFVIVMIITRAQIDILIYDQLWQILKIIGNNVIPYYDINTLYTNSQIDCI